MQRPNVDDDLTLVTDFGKTEAICIDVLENPATEEGILLKVMARGHSNKASKSGLWIATDQKLAQLSRMFLSKPSTAKSRSRRSYRRSCSRGR